MFQSWEGCVVDGVATLRCLPVVFSNIVTAALVFAGIVALFFIIISGYKLITSGGDPKQVEGGRKTLTYAIIGLVLIFLSFAIVRFISISTGTECINNFGFNQCNDKGAEGVSGMGGYDNPEAIGNKDGSNKGKKNDKNNKNDKNKNNKKKDNNNNRNRN